MLSEAYRSAWLQRRPHLRSWPPCQLAQRYRPLSADQCSCTHVGRGSSAAAAGGGAAAGTHGLQKDQKTHQEPGRKRTERGVVTVNEVVALNPLKTIVSDVFVECSRRKGAAMEKLCGPVLSPECWRQEVGTRERRLQKGESVIVTQVGKVGGGPDYRGLCE